MLLFPIFFPFLLAPMMKSGRGLWICVRSFVRPSIHTLVTRGWMMRFVTKICQLHRLAQGCCIIRGDDMFIVFPSFFLSVFLPSPSISLWHYFPPSLSIPIFPSLPLTLFLLSLTSYLFLFSPYPCFPLSLSTHLYFFCSLFPSLFLSLSLALKCKGEVSDRFNLKLTIYQTLCLGSTLI